MNNNNNNNNNPYKWLNSCNWPIDGILKGSTTPFQSGPGSNANERVLHIPQTQGLKLHYQIQFCVEHFDFVSLFNGILPLVGYLIPKSSL